MLELQLMRYCYCIHMTMKSSVTCSYSGGRVTYYGVYDLSGIEPAFMNAHKWLLTNFDCSALWLKDRNALIQSLSINPEFLRNKHVKFSGEFANPRIREHLQCMRFQLLKKPRRSRIAIFAGAGRWTNQELDSNCWLSFYSSFWYRT